MLGSKPSKGAIPAKPINQVLDSRFLQVLSVKQRDLQDALILVNLDEYKYGHVDKAIQEKIIQTLHDLAPQSAWLGITKKYNLSVYDRKSFQNKDLLVTIKASADERTDYELVEKQIKTAIPEAKSINFVYNELEIDFP